MPQEFHVLQCFHCSTFQVHQVKKSSNKWNCKLCGEKQSIKKVFGRGSGADCRHHVQRLNTLRQCQDEKQLRQMYNQDVTSVNQEDMYHGSNQHFQTLKTFNQHQEVKQEQMHCRSNQHLQFMSCGRNQQVNSVDVNSTVDCRFTPNPTTVSGSSSKWSLYMDKIQNNTEEEENSDPMNDQYTTDAQAFYGSRKRKRSIQWEKKGRIYGNLQEQSSPYDSSESHIQGLSSDTSTNRQKFDGQLYSDITCDDTTATSFVACYQKKVKNVSNMLETFSQSASIQNSPSGFHFQGKKPKAMSVMESSIRGGSHEGQKEIYLTQESGRSKTFNTLKTGKHKSGPQNISLSTNISKWDQFMDVKCNESSSEEEEENCISSVKNESQTNSIEEDHSSNVTSHQVFVR